MDMQCRLLLYFDQRRIINKMKNICDRFFEKNNEETIRKFPLARYVLHLDVMDLFDFYPGLGDFLLKEPLMWQKLCTEIFYACLKSVDNHMNKVIGISQALTIIRLSCLPAFLFDSKFKTYNQIVAYTGLLIDISKPTNYAYYSVWSCPEECEDNEIILHYIPKTPPKCFVCRSTLFENKELRQCCDQVTATFKLQDNIFCKKLTIIDDLILELKLGVLYDIHAVVLKKVTSVWSIEEIPYLPTTLSSSICPDVEDLYAKCEGLPWKFIYCLSICIGSNIRPLNSFMNVKINLLMSVCSVKAFIATGSAIIHSLASGYDTGYVSKLMMHAAKLAHRFVNFGTSNTSATTALLAASSGICIMPLPLQAYSQKLIHCITSAIESGEIVHETGNVKLKCAIWAQGMDLKKIVQCNVNSVFQNMCRTYYDEDDELSDCILQQAIHPVKMYEDEEILKTVAFYLDTVAGITVSLNLDAENLLRNYFLAARKNWPKAVTSGSLKALVNICATSARICKRSTANVTDAIFAIWLHASGAPEPRFVPAEYLDTPADLNKLNEILKNFCIWLEQFSECRICNFLRMNK